MDFPRCQKGGSTMKVIATIEMDVEVIDTKYKDEELKRDIYWDLEPHVEDLQASIEAYKIKNFNLKIVI